MTAKRKAQRKRKSRLPLWIALGALTLMLLAGGVLWAVWGRKKPDGPLLSVVWSYRPTAYEKVPGVDAFLPTWLNVEADEAGEPVLRDMEAMGYTADVDGYIAAAHTDGAEVWPTVVCFEEGLSAQIMESEATRAAFARALTQWVTGHGADGLCFDFEHMDPADAEKFTDLVRRTDEALPGKTTVAAVTVPLRYKDTENWYQCYDRPSLAQAADYVAVMTYDAHREAAGPTAPLDWVKAALARTVKEVPAEKLLMGVPFYGVDTVTDAAGERKTQTLSAAALEKLTNTGSWGEGEDTVTLAEWTDCGTWDETYAVTFCAFTDTEGATHEIWMEDERSLEAKAGAARKYGLAGWAVWRQNQGTEALFTALTDLAAGGEKND